MPMTQPTAEDRRIAKELELRAGYGGTLPTLRESIAQALADRTEACAVAAEKCADDRWGNDRDEAYNHGAEAAAAAIRRMGQPRTIYCRRCGGEAVRLGAKLLHVVEPAGWHDVEVGQ